MANITQALIALALATLFLFVGTRLLRTVAVNVRRKSWLISEGQITSVWIRPSWLEGYYREFVEYLYVVDGITYQKARSRFTLASDIHKLTSAQPPFIGKTQLVRICYDPENHSESALAQDIVSTIESIVTFVCGIGCLALGIGISIVPIAFIFDLAGGVPR